MTGTIRRGKITRADLANWDGKTATYSRIDATGGTTTGLAIGNAVDVLQVYGSGTDRLRASILAAIRQIGTTAVTLVFAPGTWTIDDDLTVPSNFSCIVSSGCVFNVSSGKTLTFSGEVAAEYATSWTSGSGSVVVSQESINGAVYHRTALEVSASVTPTNYRYQPGDARRYGLGDGTTATHTALTNALAANHIVWIVNSGSSFNYTSAATVPSNRKIIGMGWPKFLQNADDINLFVLSDSVNVEITGIWADGNSKGVTLGAYLNCGVMSNDTVADLVKNCHIHDNRFTGLYSWAISFAGAASGNYSHDVWLNNNLIENQVDEGINLYYIDRAIVNGTAILNHAKEAIKATNAKNIDILNNNIRNAATGATDGPLINVGTDCSNILIEGNNTYKGNKGIGIEKRVSYLRIIGNHCEACLQEGIGVAGTAGDTVAMNHMTIASNVTKDTGQHGIKVQGIVGYEAYAITIDNNIIENCGTDTAAGGIQVFRAVDCIISGNVVKNSAKEGIIVSTATYAVASSNYVNSTQQHGIRITTVTNATVNSNVVIDANRAASTYNGIDIDSACTYGTTFGNVSETTSGTTTYGINNQATNGRTAHNVLTNYATSPYKGTGTAKQDDFLTGQLGVSNSAAATTLGTVNGKFQVFDANGTSVGYVPTYNSIT